MLSPSINHGSALNSMRSPLSPMRRRNNSFYVSDNEDAENSPLQITKNKHGLMKLMRSPYTKKIKTKPTTCAATQTTQDAIIRTEAPSAAVVDEAAAAALSMTHARQFRGMKMQLHAFKVTNEKLQEELTTYKTAAIDVARVARSARMALKTSQDQHVELQEQLTTYKTAAMDVARQSRSARMALKTSQDHNVVLQEELQHFTDYSVNVAEKLDRRLKRMVKAAQKSQLEGKELRQQNEILQQLLVSEEEKNSDAIENYDNVALFYGATFCMAIFAALIAAAITFR